jgi:phosphomannomutase
MITSYIFDVDGTLTPARKSMEKEFHDSFISWVESQLGLGNNVYLVTGSDKEKTVEQVGLKLYNLVDGVYQNCGNELYKNGKLCKSNKWVISKKIDAKVDELLQSSKWYGKSSGNKELRAGMLNISTVGRDCSAEDRAEYCQWDRENGERRRITNELNIAFPSIEAVVGGEISIDIYPKGRDKSQVLGDMVGDTVFFGDKCDRGGNDYSISCRATERYHVADWEQTSDILAILSKLDEIDKEDKLCEL